VTEVWCNVLWTCEDCSYEEEVVVRPSGLKDLKAHHECEED
jgi:hypothetical protein